MRIASTRESDMRGKIAIQRSPLRLSFALVAFVFLSCAPVEGGEQMFARGVGSTSCAKFTEINKTDPGFVDLVFASWAHGFMSGWNFSTLQQRQYRDLRARSSESLMTGIRTYCDSHPLATFAKAVVEVYSSLPVRYNSH